jgi:hypothetical protein
MSDAATLEVASSLRQGNVMDIEFLYWEDCPSHERALELLRQVLRDASLPDTVRIVEIETDEEAEELMFPGSPTIRVNGVDIEPDVDDAVVGLTCRAYRDSGGKISPLPPREMIVRAVDAARNS